MLNFGNVTWKWLRGGGSDEFAKGLVFINSVFCGLGSRSLKSTTTATMVGGPKEFGGTKGCNCFFEREDQKCCIVFLKTKIDQEMNI